MIRSTRHLLRAANQIPPTSCAVAVLAETLGVIRRRRRSKRCALAVSLVGCYLAGIGTMAAWRPGGSGASPIAAEQAMTAEQPLPHVPPPVRPRPTDSDMRQVAAAEPNSFESWRRIGDHYLRDSGDILLAVRGYTRALDLATDEERTISPGQDNWLLMALKDARAKERNHVRSEQN